MIRAIIFDCFGVLTTDAWKQIWSDASLTEETRRRAHEIDVQVNRGEMSYDEFIHEITQLIDMTEDEIRARFDANEADEELLDYIKMELKPQYKIGLLSNAAENWLNRLFTPAQVALFDAITLSCELGVTKPDVRIYEDNMRKLGVEPNECVFVDDREKYCEGARVLGMQAICYENFAQFTHNLKEVLA